MAPTEVQAARPDGELFERDDVLEQLAGFADTVSRDAGGTAVILGSAGLGKTTLLDRACDLGAERGVMPLRAAGAELETVIPFGVVHQLLDPIVRRDPSLVVDGPGARAWRALEGGAEVDEAINRGLDWLIADSLAGRPGLVVIDDLQWIDEPSLRFVAHLVHRTGPGRLAVLTASRDRESAIRCGMFRSEAVIVGVEPLSITGCRSMVRRHLPDLGAREMTDLWTATGGNPFFIRHALDFLVDHPDTTPGEAVSTDLIAFVERGLHRLPAPARRLAEALAVLEDEPDLAIVASVTGLDSNGILDASDDLVAGQFTTTARPLALRHPLVRSAIYESMTGSARSSVHRAAARFLTSRGDDATAAGRHLLHSHPAGDPATVETLLRAAQQALDRGDSPTACILLERARREPAPVQAHGRLALELGRAYLGAGDSRAVDELETALSLADGVTERGAVLESLLRARGVFDRLDRLDLTVERELAELAKVDPDRVLTIEAEALAAARLSVDLTSWQVDRLRRWEGRIEGRTHGERLMLANLATQAAVDGRSAAEVAALARAALGDGRLIDQAGGTSLLIHKPIWTLIWVEAYDEARRHLEAIETAAGHNGSSITHILTSLLASHLDLAVGDLDLADEHAAAALAATKELPRGWAGVPATVAAVLEVDLERGRLAEADALLETTDLAGPVADSIAHRMALAARARLRLVQGRVDDALTDALEVVRRQEAHPVAPEHQVPWRATAALALLEAGRPDEAVDLARANLESARAWGTPRAIAQALATMAQTSPPASAVELLSEAVDLLVPSPSALDLAWARHHRGMARIRVAERSEAVDDLRSALDLAGSLRATRLEVLTRRALNQLGLRPRRSARRGADALTATERRVAGLAAQRRTNREIAEIMFVTPRTIETHLTSTYRKLGVAGRGELARALSGSTD